MAVDGNLAQINNGITCAHTTKGTVQQPAWWQVDLGNAYRITGITIYNREQDCKCILDDHNTNVLINKIEQEKVKQRLFYRDGLC